MKIRIFSTTLFVVLVGVFTTGCDLDRYPYDMSTVDNIDIGNLQSITLGTYAKLKEEYYYKTLHQVGEYGGDNVALSGPTSDALQYIYRYERQSDNYYTGRVWRFTYQMVANVNRMIEEMELFETDDASDAALVRHLHGENLVLRGFLYFNCCNIFGRQYMDANGPENNLGIPIKTVSDVDYYPPRATVKEVYDQILADATLGAAYLKRDDNSPERNNTMINQEVAWAFLSRLHLYMGNWKEAEAYADSVISSNTYELLTGDTYKTYPQHVPENNKETIWCIRMVKDSDYKDYYMDYYSVGSMYSIRDGHGWGEMFPSQTYLDLLREYPQDLRSGFIEEQYDAEDPRMWMIYVDGDNYVTKTVEQSGTDYIITEDPGMYNSNTVRQEEVNGVTRYYVEIGNERFDVWIENALSFTKALPARYILKCSYQEHQGQLYSPVLFRLAEMYLNRAEARYHQGDLQGAIEDVNVIRRRAGIPERSVADAANNDQILEWVLNERRLELAWEAHRKYDVFRNRLTLDRQYPGQHLSASNPMTQLAPDDVRVIELIPQAEINVYPIELVQHP